MPARSSVARGLYIGLAALCFALGLAGIFLPLLPTTPFMLLAVTLASRGSARFAAWIRANRFAGPVIAAWERERAIPRRAKWMAVIMLAFSMIATALILESPWLRLGLMMALALLALFIVTRRGPSQMQ